ncbi:MAG: trypsin-like serine protease [Proteobacteria bacterium]|nr:trypsin-like serine protease [Pseudomonadota bacterium]
MPIYEDSSLFWRKTAALLDAVFDKRRLVVPFYEYPFVTNCYLESTFEEFGSCRGTATLISPYCLITAGHCLLYKRKFPKSIRCALGMSGGVAKDISSVNSFYVHPKYLESENPDYDIGIIRIGEPFGKKYGAMSLRELDRQELMEMRVNVTGYPSQRKFTEILFDRLSSSMYTMDGEIRAVTDHKIYYEVDTSGGQSGSGVWIPNQEKAVECIAVHTTGDKVNGNGAVRINQESGQIIGEWLSKLSEI